MEKTLNKDTKEQNQEKEEITAEEDVSCLLYTSDAADE